MKELILIFANGEKAELTEASFSLGGNTKKLHVVRGKTSGAFIASGSFQWTAAVKAISILIIKGVLAKEQCASPILSGGKGSLAASLDHALVKAPLLLLDMFGDDESGRPLLERFTSITNPGRKRPWQVSISKLR